MADVVRVASHTPVEVAQLVAGYRHSCRIIACLNKAWHAAVRCLADLLYERFLQSTFSVDMICDDGGKKILSPEKAKLRLDRLLHNKIATPTLDVRFWYTAQLYLHMFCGLKGNITFRDILLHCGRNSDIGKIYGFRQLLPEQDMLAADCRPVETHMFRQNAFVTTRDLSCPSLGYTVREVFRTLHLMVQAWYDKLEPQLLYCEVFGCEFCTARSLWLQGHG